MNMNSQSAALGMTIAERQHEMQCSWNIFNVGKRDYSFSGHFILPPISQDGARCIQNQAREMRIPSLLTARPKQRAISRMPVWGISPWSRRQCCHSLSASSHSQLGLILKMKFSLTSITQVKTGLRSSALQNIKLCFHLHCSEIPFNQLRKKISKDNLIVSQ